MSKIDLISVDTESASSALSLAHALMIRAAQVIDGAPFNKSIDWDDCFPMGLKIDGEKATLHWQECDCGYDGDRKIDKESCEFPSRLLFVSDDDLERFHTEAKLEEERQETLRRERYNAEQVARSERAERALLAKLKAKYPD